MQPSRVALLTLLLTTTGLAGCLNDPPDPDPLEGAASHDILVDNPWEGEPLSETFHPPGEVITRSRSDRRANVAPPGATPYVAFDQAMEQFLRHNGIGAASVAVLQNSQLRYENGYGHLDRSATQPTDTEALFRMASLVKPMTAAVIGYLVREGRLSYDDPVFCLPPDPDPDCRLPIAPHPARPIADDRIEDVTIGHLIAHQTGWSLGPCLEPLMGESVFEVAADLGIGMPPPTWRLAQWMIGEPMEFDPGTQPTGVNTYCNMGYAILGLIAEAETGANMEALYRAYIWEPLEIEGDIAPAKSLPGDRDPREPFYACDGGMTKSLYPPHEDVCYADGGFDLDAAFALGGLMATPAAMATFYEVYNNDGSVREVSPFERSGHQGILPGTMATAERFGEATAGAVGDIQVVVVFNRFAIHDEFPLTGVEAPLLQVLHARLLAGVAAADGAADEP